MQEQLTRHPFPSVLFRPMSGHHEDASETLSFRWWTELKAAGRDRLIHKPIRQKLHRLEDAAISYWDLWEPARDVVFADLKPRYAARLGHIPAVCMNAAMRVMSTHDIPDDAETQFEIDAEELKQCRDNVGDSAEVNALRTHRQVLKALIDETLDDIREHIDKLATRLERG